ncbi:rRNA adenine N-6-methyltransferase family protein [Thermogladius sp. KZ2Tp1]|uniref:rRNA adenine N-6-methyltransferase family protein n=1 Tax=Thermogladius sp. KZ2Tp1 TaxID=3136289 RepID=UPI003DA93E01
MVSSYNVDPDSFRAVFRRVVERVKSSRVKLRKSLSQHITASPRVVNWVLESVDRSAVTLEVGSGTGILTYFLCRAVKVPVLAVEIDSAFADLSREVVSCRNAVVLVGDVLDLEITADQVVSSVPYAISGRLLSKIARSNSVRRAVLILQREVVDRMLSSPGEDAYGRLSVLVKLLFDVTPGPLFHRAEFYPRPKVESRGVVLVRKRVYDDDVALVEELTRALFPFRRKIVGGVVERVFKVGREELGRIGLNWSTRVYELSEGDLLRLAEYLRSRGIL